MKRFHWTIAGGLLFSCLMGLPPGQSLAQEGLIPHNEGSHAALAVQSIAPAASGWSPLGSGMNGTVYAIESDGAGHLYVGGDFTTAGGVPAINIAMWNGTSWSALGDGLDGIVLSLLYDGSGNLYAGGMFTHSGGLTVNYIAKWNGTSWSRMGNGFNNRVWAMAIDNLGNLYAGGYFMDFGQNEPDYIARWTGSSWVEVGGGMRGEEGMFMGYVYDLLIDHNGDLVAVGDFDYAGNVASQGIARWNGSTWSAFGDGKGYGANAVVEDPNHNIYVGGGFFDWPTTTSDMIVRWDGTGWHDLDGGMNGDIEAMAFGQDGNLYAVGEFATAGTTNAWRVARWDGSHWWSLGSGLDNTVWAVEMDEEGNLYVGGEFVTAGGSPADHIAKWKAPPIDLSISKTDGKTSVIPGASNTYTITVTNLSSETAYGVMVQDTFPSTFTDVTWSCSATVGSGCGSTAGAWNINTNLTLAGGGIATFVATGTVSSNAVCLLANTASVTLTTGEADPDLSNNQATDTSQIPNGSCVFLPIVKRDS